MHHAYTLEFSDERKRGDGFASIHDVVLVVYWYCCIWIRYSCIRIKCHRMTRCVLSTNIESVICDNISYVKKEDNDDDDETNFVCILKMIIRVKDFWEKKNFPHQLRFPFSLIFVIDCQTVFSCQQETKFNYDIVVLLLTSAAYIKSISDNLRKEKCRLFSRSNGMIN